MFVLSACAAGDDSVASNDWSNPGTTGGTGTETPGGGVAGATGTPPAGGSQLVPGGPAAPIDDSCAATLVHAPPASHAPVDVVFVIDTSVSMLDETMNVAANISAFVDNVSQAGTDTRLVIVTRDDLATGTPLARDSMRYRFVPAEVASGMLYTVTLASLPSFADLLRPNAPVHLVMVTDDNDLMPGATFRASMEQALARPFTLHAIASENVGGFPCANPICGGLPIPAICGAANPGDEYYAIAQATDGETLSICTSDWTGLFARLQSAVIASAPLPCDYTIPDKNGGLVDFERVQVVYSDSAGNESQFPRAQGATQCANTVAWHYDDPTRPGKVILCPAACRAVQAGGSMDIAFGCAPVLL